MAPSLPSGRPRAVFAALLTALLAGSGAKGVLRHVRDVARDGPLGMPVHGHPRWLSAAYFRWIDVRTPERQVAARLDSLLPPGAPAVHVGSVWSLARVRYHLYPRPVVDRTTDNEPGKIARALAPAEVAIIEDHPGDMAPRLGAEPGIELLGRIGSLDLVRRADPAAAPSRRAP